MGRRTEVGVQGDDPQTIFSPDHVRRVVLPSKVGSRMGQPPLVLPESRQMLVVPIAYPFQYSFPAREDAHTSRTVRSAPRLASWEGAVTCSWVSPTSIDRRVYRWMARTCGTSRGYREPHTPGRYRAFS